MQISYIKISITVENIILKDYLGLKTFHTKPILNFKLASDTFILEAGLIVSISSSKFEYLTSFGIDLYFSNHIRISEVGSSVGVRGASHGIPWYTVTP